MIQPKSFFLLPHSLLLASGALFCGAANAQSIAVQGVSPATSFASASGGVADVHLSAATSSRPGSSLARFASGTGNIIYLAAGTLLPLVEDGKDGKEHSLRTADSLISATLITEALKQIVRERRPDSNSRDSFPSGHATAAFAVATMQAHYHPKQALLWYAGAAGISYSRVSLRRHYTRDVLAGAAIGFLASRLELKQGRGLLLFPFIHNKSEGGGSGIGVSKSF